MNTFVIYGAAGYTGSMAAEHAATAMLNLVLAGREKARAKLEALANRLGAAVKLFPLDEPDATVTSLAGWGAVKHSYVKIGDAWTAR